MSCNFPLILGLYIENNGTMGETCYSYKIGKKHKYLTISKAGVSFYSKSLPSPLLNSGYAFALRDFKDVPLKLFKK